MTVEQPQLLERKFLLRLLGELNDIEVLLLAAEGESGDTREAFCERHAGAINRPYPAFGAPQSEHVTAAIFDGYDQHLERLGLLEFGYPVSGKKGEIPEFDRMGRLKGATLRISSLGRALLRAIGQPSELDRATDACNST